MSVRQVLLIAVAGFLAGTACDRPRADRDRSSPATSRAASTATGFLMGLAPSPTASASADAGPRVDALAHEIDARGAGLGRLVDDASFVDTAGKPGQLAAYRGKTLVVLSSSSTCPVARKYLPTLRDLANELTAAGIAVLITFPEPAEDAKKIAESHDLDGVTARVVVGPALARALGAKTATEAFVIDGARTLRFRGAIDDQYAIGGALPAPRQAFLRDALASVKAGERPSVEATTAPGCALNEEPATPIASSTRAPTWTRDVSRIVQDRCQSCHRPGQAAPFPLLTFEDVKSRAAMVDVVVDARIMPPWYARHDNHDVGTWKNDRSLTDAQRTTLLAWIHGGTPQGDPKDAPLPRAFSSDYAIGKPDAVIRLTDPEPVPERGVLPYRHLVVETGFTEDTWVNRLEIHPDHRQVVHHVSLYLLPPAPEGTPADAGLLPRDLAVVADARKFIGTLVPGGESESFAPNEGRLIPKRSRILARVHYTPNGRKVAASTLQIGFVFNKARPEHEIVASCAIVQELAIPPGAKGVEFSARTRFARPTRILRFAPHMHFRGKRMRFVASLPDGTERVLFDGDYDFRWQLWYEPAMPLELPAGSRIEVTGTFDNSEANPQNPDPKATVHYGPQTTDEMMDGCMAVTELR